MCFVFLQVLKKGHDFHEDPFANFSYTPPKPAGRYRHFIRKQKFKNMGSVSQSREKMGSNTSLSSMGFTGRTMLFHPLDPLGPKGYCLSRHSPYATTRRAASFGYYSIMVQQVEFVI